MSSERSETLLNIMLGKTFDTLSQRSEFDGETIERLRKLALSGRLAKHEAVEQALSDLQEAQDESTRT